MRLPPLSTKLALVLLVVITVAGGALRLHRAADAPPRISADQTAYMKIAGDLRRQHTYGVLQDGDPLHWSPGAPVLFAVAQKLGGDRVSQGPDSRSARTAEALVGTATILAAAWLGWLLIGPLGGVLVAAFLAFYPPALPASQVLVSEPIGALTVTVAAALLVLAMRRGGLGWFALAGAGFGVASLARPDVAPIAALTLLAAGLLTVRPSWKGRSLLVGAAAVGMILAVAPWTLVASRMADELVPITRGSNTALMMGTYVAADGTVSGLKYDQSNRVRLRYARMAGVRTWKLPGAETIDTLVSARSGDRDTRVGAQVRANLKDCLLHSQLDCAAMQVRKLGRMWGGPFTSGQGVAGASRAWHIVLVLAAWLGLLVAVARTGNRVLGVLLLFLIGHTVLNTLYVAEARHAYRVLPILLAGGVAGWAALLEPVLAARRRTAPARDGGGGSVRVGSGAGAGSPATA